MIDSHCHINLLPEGQRAEAVQRAKDAGITAMQNISTTIQESKTVIAQALQYEGMHASVGTHPCNVHEEPNITAEEISQIVTKNAPTVVGIGETGLDYWHKSDATTKQLQQKQFEQHIIAAQQTNKTVIVHTREAEEDTLEIIQRYHKNTTFLIHCFTGSHPFLQQLLSLGAYISYSGIVTFKNAQPLKQCMLETPLERMLIETDAPYLAPTPMRGRPNEPAYLKYTAEFIAKERGIPLQTLIETTSQTFHQIFR